ncbi:fatty acid desaturase [Litorimonas sp. WD9-15]|uniref:fatty acid desaturase n=1 Tax=Litorimonas sp. WD9-15 TaxID=3418716 RepID=UPI003D004EEE
MSFGSGPRRQYGRYYLLDYFVILMFLTGIAILSLKSAIIILSLYVIITFFSLRTDYSTHIGEKSNGDIAFANNCRDKVFNRFFWNFGYHVGHHIKPSTHWTELPAYEASLGVTLQDDNIQTNSFNFFGLLMPPFLNWSSAKFAKCP